jgi:hypothetical protein
LNKWAKIISNSVTQCWNIICSQGFNHTDTESSEST